MQYIAHWPQTPAGKNICHTCSTIEPCIVNVLVNHSFASAVTWRRQLCVMWPVRPWLIKYDSPNHLNTHSDWSGSGLTLMSMIGRWVSMQTILNCLHNRGFMGMFACVCVFVKEPDSTVPSTCELHDDRLVLWMATWRSIGGGWKIFAWTLFRERGRGETHQQKDAPMIVLQMLSMYYTQIHKGILRAKEVKLHSIKLFLTWISVW